MKNKITQLTVKRNEKQRKFDNEIRKLKDKIKPISEILESDNK